MPEIQAFRAVRYDLGHIGSLSDVIAPPYDVIDPDLQAELYRRHPCNFVRLILNRMEPGDDEANNRYTRARRFLRNWRSEGVLFEESHPAIYVYHQTFQAAGHQFTRRGFMCRMRLSPFGQGLVFPHEETRPGPKIDRLMLTAVCKANLSQIFGLYPDASGEVESLLAAAIDGRTPLEAVDHLGVVNRMWPVTDLTVVSAVAVRMSPKPLFVADGHHRYETACEYQKQVYDSGALRTDHPANFVLMMCVAMEDPGLVVLPTHRLFARVPSLTSDELVARLEPYFDSRPAGRNPDAAEAAWEEIELAGDQSNLALYTQKDQVWTLFRLTEAGQARMADVAKEHNEEWRGLGVSILHRLIIETLLESPDLTDTKYVHLVEELTKELAARQYPMAALVMPATVQHIRDVSMQGERMPAKSTYFYPKLLSGLVINPLE